jgi:hypothetical protein
MHHMTIQSIGNKDDLFPVSRCRVNKLSVKGRRLDQTH